VNVVVHYTLTVVTDYCYCTLKLVNSSVHKHGRRRSLGGKSEVGK
jgi:hypothetical protein